MKYPTASQPLPNGMSTVTQRHLSRRPTRISAVRPNGISAVTYPHVSRDRRLRCRLRTDIKIDSKGRTYLFRFDCAGLIDSTAISASYAPAAHSREAVVLSASKSKSSKLVKVGLA